MPRSTQSCIALPDPLDSLAAPAPPAPRSESSAAASPARTRSPASAGRSSVRWPAPSPATPPHCETETESQPAAFSPTAGASSPSSTMNPPPIEKNIRCSSIRSAASYAMNRNPFGCRIAAPGGNIVPRSKTRSLYLVECNRPNARQLNPPRLLEFPPPLTQSPQDQSSPARCPPIPAAPRGPSRGPARSAPASRKAPPAPAPRAPASPAPQAAAQTGKPPASAPSCANSMAHPDFVEIEKTRRHESNCRSVNGGQWSVVSG